MTDEPDAIHIDITVDTSRIDAVFEAHRQSLRCVHCNLPQEGHGRRYAAIPGWHPWTAERSVNPGPPPLWLPPVVGNQRQETS